MIEEVRKVKIAEIEEEITQLETMKIEPKKYNWLEKSMFKKTEYEADQRRIKREEQQRQEKIDTLKEKKKKYMEVRYIQGFELTFEEAIKLLEEKGIPAILNESDFTNVWKEEKPDVDNLEGLILIHKTDYAPTDSRIKSTKESKSYVEETHIIAGHKIQTRVRKSRNTVHFAVNGEVSSHFYGNWDDKKYAILIPFTDIPKEKFGNVNAADTYTIGGVNLTPNSWILVPKGEKKLIQKNNPNVNVIEYEGKSVTKYADQVVKMLGYSIESVDKFGWHDSISNRKFERLIRDNGLTSVSHYYSIHSYNENFETYMQIVVQVMQYVKENIEVLKNKNFLDELTKFLEKYISQASSQTKNLKQTIIDIQNYLLAESFVIPEENISKFYEKITSYESIPYYITIEIIDLLKKSQEEEKEHTTGKSK